MSNYKLILFAYVIFISLVNALAPLKECIIGGEEADERFFRYQVAILGRKNITGELSPICGGGLISESFVISVRHCFIHPNGMLMEVSFIVAIGTINLNSGMGMHVDVIEIYILKNDGIKHDIALLKLDAELNVDGYPFLSKLNLPNYGDSLMENIGIVAGFGYTSVETEFNSSGGSQRIRGKSNFLLNFGRVQIMSMALCRFYYPYLNDYQFCGKMIPFHKGVKTGICKGDGGSPLVIHSDTIIGLASRNPIDCNDSVSGCIYTKILAYITFIESVLLGAPVNNVLVYPNLPFVPQYIE